MIQIEREKRLTSAPTSLKQLPAADNSGSDSLRVVSFLKPRIDTETGQREYALIRLLTPSLVEEELDLVRTQDRLMRGGLPK